MVFEFFDLVSGVDESFICIKRLDELIDGAFVYRRVALVSACIVCEDAYFRVCHHPSMPAYGVCVCFKSIKIRNVCGG